MLPSHTLITWLSHHFTRWLLKWNISIWCLGVVILTIVIATASYFFPITKHQQGCLNPTKFKEFRLVRRTQLTHNTWRFRFALLKTNFGLGLPVGNHVLCRGRDTEGREVVRPYTPITLDSDIGFFELVVKLYPKGKMSHHFREIREGDYLSVKGPKGGFRYKSGEWRALGMLAGGSGITPMFQIIRAVLEDPHDMTQIHLIYANITADDILLREELDGFARENREALRVSYVLSKPPQGWGGGVGHISEDMIRHLCPPPQHGIMILRCGPAGMNRAIAAHLDALGYHSLMQFQF